MCVLAHSDYIDIHSTWAVNHNYQDHFSPNINNGPQLKYLGLVNAFLIAPPFLTIYADLSPDNIKVCHGGVEILRIMGRAITKP